MGRDKERERGREEEEEGEEGKKQYLTVHRHQVRVGSDDFADAHSTAAHT